jgi:pentatricopeptide repeat protein
VLTKSWAVAEIASLCKSLKDLVRQKKLGLAQKMLEESIPRIVPFGLASPFNIVLNALCQSGNLPAAEELFMKMRRASIAADVFTYAASLE